MAELKISEVILSQRHQRNMTQEELAAALGVSPQAVSNWERGGYPDITMLPNIANYFGITVDALIGNDAIGQEKDIEQFFDTIDEIEDDEKRLRYAMEYARKYPQRFGIANALCCLIVDLPEAKRREHLPLLRETCEKILAECTVQGFRENAIQYMCYTCTDEEFREKWEDLCACSYEAHRREVEEERLWRLGRRDETRAHFDVNNLHILLHFMCRTNRNWAAAQRAAEWFKIQIRLLEFLSEDGEIPRAWWGRYAELHFKAGCASFGYGNYADGCAFLEKAFALFPRWYAIPNGEKLEVGSKWLFGGVRVIKNDWRYELPGGEPQRLNNAYVFGDYRGFMYSAMTAPQGWEWFNSVRSEERFREYIARAKKLDEEWGYSAEAE